MKRLLVSSFSTTALSVLLLSGAASAHFNLTNPPAADNATDGGKGAPPCGPTSASNVVTSVQGGQQLSIELSETVMHPGHYRFALAATPGQIPGDPEVQTNNGQSVSATIDTTATPGVLMDDVFDHTTGTAPIKWQMDLRVPNVNCDSCTLQVIEFMAEHGANPGGGYFYHHCATLKIAADMTQPLDDVPGVSGSSGGAMTGAAGSSSMPPAMASGGAGGAGGMAAPAAGGTSGMAAAKPPAGGTGQTASASNGTMTPAASSSATGTGVASAAMPTGAAAGMAAMTGSTSTTSNALTPAAPPQSSDNGGGCALSPAASRSSAAGALALLALSLGWVGRRRR